MSSCSNCNSCNSCDWNGCNACGCSDCSNCGSCNNCNNCNSCNSCGSCDNCSGCNGCGSCDNCNSCNSCNHPWSRFGFNVCASCNGCGCESCNWFGFNWNGCGDWWNGCWNPWNWNRCSSCRNHSSCPFPQWIHPICCNPTRFCCAGNENGATLVIHKIVLETNANQSCTPTTFSLRITGPSYPCGEIFSLRAGSCLELDEPLVISGLEPGCYEIEEVGNCCRDFISTLTGPVCGGCVTLTNSAAPTVVTIVSRRRSCRSCGCSSCSCF